MNIPLEKLYNKHLNEDCIIVGAGPTMKQFNYKKFRGKIIFIGSVILRFNKVIKPHYLVSSNNHFPVLEIKSHLKILNSLKKTFWIMSDTSCYNDIWKFDPKKFNKLKIKYSTFDDRHYNFKKCTPEKNCCKFLKIYPKRQTLIETIERKFNKKYKFKNASGVSVAEHAIAIAVFMGFKKILIQGVDLPRKYYQGQKLGTQKKYYGFESKYAKRILNETLKICRKKYFLYYLKNLDFIPYLKGLVIRCKKIVKKDFSDFSNNIEYSLKLIQWLFNIHTERNKKIIILNKNSELAKLKSINIISEKDIKKYKNMFK